MWTGLRGSINDDGVWRFRRRPRAPEVEVFQVEEVGHGTILTDEFLNWRIKLAIGVDPISKDDAEA